MQSHLKYAFCGPGLDVEQAESEVSAAAEMESMDQSLWQAASERVLLHATILRALKFGDRPPPGFQQQLRLEKQQTNQAAQESSTASVESTVQDRHNKSAASTDQPAQMNNSQTRAAIVDGLSRMGPLSAARQQAAALLSEQPHSIRCSMRVLCRDVPLRPR